MKKYYSLVVFSLFILQSCSPVEEVTNEGELDIGIADTDNGADVDPADADVDSSNPSNADVDLSDGDADATTTADADTGDQEPMAAVDILWTIDNTAHMCDSQATIREGMERFADAISDIDFHIAVTTTHMAEDSFLEPVARPGHFQSTPQPLPGFPEQCQSIDSIIKSIEIAVGCTENPDDWVDLLTPDMDELGCILDYACEENDDLESFFPDPDSYRTIPTVLRAQDYTGADEIVDVDGLKADLLCATQVGSRGYGFEQGLAAAVKALSPEMTGGLDAAPGSFPNAGFLRPNAATAAIFISTENDCSHNGELDETTICGDVQCTIQENLGEDGDLLAVSDLREDFMRNIALSKEWDVDQDTSLEELQALFEDSLFAASIHGAFELNSEIDADSCTQTVSIEPACDDARVAWSGHRYSEFIEGFPSFYPAPEGSEDYQDIPGLICGDFASNFDDIAALFIQ